MDFKLSQVLEITITAVLLYLVLSNWYGFQQILQTGGSVYSQSVRALQGR